MKEIKSNEQNFPSLEVQEKRKKVLLLCVDNDPESRMILQLAEKAGIHFIRSTQPLGARLDQESEIARRIGITDFPEVWTVEMPGPELERELQKLGKNISPIDHHSYGKGEDLLDRTKDKSGVRRTSSLEQFIERAGITDDEMRSWGFDPKTTRGLGIFDDRYVQGLRDEGYSQEEINRVVDSNVTLRIQLDPAFKAKMPVAEKVWSESADQSGFLVLRSFYNQSIRAELSLISIKKGQDTKPLIIVDENGDKIYVQNIDPGIVARLQQKIHGGKKTFTFGAGRCWGVENTGSDNSVTVEEIFIAIENKNF